MYISFAESLYSNVCGGLKAGVETLLYETPAEAIAFLISSVAIKIFFPSFSAPLLGIGLSLLATKLVLKIFVRYDSIALIELTKKTCKFNKDYPKLQLITFIFALAISTLSRTLALILGLALGSFGAIILDVEHYKLIQQAQRKSQEKENIC